MNKLKNKYVIGTHVMFFEIEMYKDFIDGMINLLETVENKKDVTIDLCLNLTQQIEKLDINKITESAILDKFNDGVQRLKDIGVEKIITYINELEKFPTDKNETTIAIIIPAIPK